jgi:hypothetical protein
MSWRPVGWDKKVTKHNLTGFIVMSRMSSLTDHELSFEAGADAMLEALKKDGTHFDKNEWTDDASFQTDEPGTVVFIPDKIKSGKAQ